MDRTIHDTPSAGILNNGLENRILQQLRDEPMIDLDVLIQILPEYSWNQIFHAVDQLARTTKITLRRHHYSYTLFSPPDAAKTPC